MSAPTQQSGLQFAGARADVDRVETVQAGSDRWLAASAAAVGAAGVISLTLGAPPGGALVVASLVAIGILAALHLYGEVRRERSPRRRSLAALLGASFVLGVAAGAGALYLLHAIVIWSSAPGPGALSVAGAYGWALALIVVGQALPSEHDRLLKAMALGLMGLSTAVLYLASKVS
jgi:hypothetical protein